MIIGELYDAREKGKRSASKGLYARFESIAITHAMQEMLLKLKHSGELNRIDYMPIARFPLDFEISQRFGEKAHSYDKKYASQGSSGYVVQGYDLSDFIKRAFAEKVKIADNDLYRYCEVIDLVNFCSQSQLAFSLKDVYLLSSDVVDYKQAFEDYLKKKRVVDIQFSEDRSTIFIKCGVDPKYNDPAYWKENK
jgi:hypothetical protein